MNDQHQRALWHDYREPGIYMITLVAERRGTPFGHLELTEGDGRTIVRLTTLGQAVERQLHELPQHAEGLAVLRAVVMPDHIHVVVQVQKPLKRHLGVLVKGFKYGTTVAYLRELDARYGGTHRVQGSRPSQQQRQQESSTDKPPITQPPAIKEPLPTSSPSSPITHSPSSSPIIPSPSSSPFIPVPSSSPITPSPSSVGPVGRGSSATTSAASSAASLSPCLVPPLWADGYNDRILMGRGQLSRMLHYVSDNPRRGWIKRQHRDLFYNKQMLRIPLTIDQARWLLREAQRLGVMQELRGVLLVEQHCSGDDWQSFPWWQPGIHAAAHAELRAALYMKMMGNPFLLDEAPLVSVRISRSTTPGALAQEKASLLERCEREGAVIITPAVSQGEEAVMQAALDAGYRVIRPQASAMSDLWAPPEALLQPTSRGQLLFLAPWPDRPQGEHPHKGIFELLNTLCRLLAER